MFRSLGDIAAWYSGGTPKAGMASFYGGDIPWAVIADLNDATVTATASTITAAGLSEIGGRVAPVGAVMVSMYGTIGRVGLVGRPMATNQAIAWAIVDQTIVTPGFLVIWLGHHRPLLNALGRGATQRNINRELIRGIQISVPPLPAQRRIVDLIATFDAQIDATRASCAAGENALSAYLEEAFANRSGPSTTVGALAALGSGPSWKASEEASFEDTGTIPVVGITSTPAGSRSVDISQRRYVGGLPPSVRTLTATSLLLIRTNGNRSRIGNVYRVPRSAIGHAYSAFQIGAAIHDPGNVPYLFWFLSTPSVQARMSEAASGSTGLGNISVRWLSRLQVPWPSDVERRRIAEVADSFDATAVGARRLLDALAVLRAALLANLLTGDRVIPGSYDRFLDGAA